MKLLAKYSAIASLVLGVSAITRAQESLEPQAADLPKSPVLASRVSELPPPVVVYPDEVLLLRTDVPHNWGHREPWVPPEIPGGEWLEVAAETVSNWTAHGGTILSLDDRTVLYQAPSYPGVAVLEWNDGSSEPIAVAFVVPGDATWGHEVELPVEILDQATGSFLPNTGGAAFRIFAVHPWCDPPRPGQRKVGEGFSYASDIRLNPPLEDLNCSSGRKSTYRYKAFELPPSEDKREHKGRFKYLGVEFDVYRERTGYVRHMHLWDCYECRSGHWVCAATSLSRT